MVGSNSRDSRAGGRGHGKLGRLQSLHLVSKILYLALCLIQCRTHFLASIFKVAAMPALTRQISQSERRQA
jgi:hypothetical protein